MSLAEERIAQQLERIADSLAVLAAKPVLEAELPMEQMRRARQALRRYLVKLAQPVGGGPR